MTEKIDLISFLKNLVNTTEQVSETINIVDENAILAKYPLVTACCKDFSNPGLVTIEGESTYISFISNTVGLVARLSSKEMFPELDVDDNFNIVYITVENKGKYIVGEDGIVYGFMTNQIKGDSQ